MISLFIGTENPVPVLRYIETRNIHRAFYTSYFLRMIKTDFLTVTLTYELMTYYSFTMSFKALPALNLGALDASICIGSPF